MTHSGRFQKPLVKVSEQNADGGMSAGYPDQEQRAGLTSVTQLHVLARMKPVRYTLHNHKILHLVTYRRVDTSMELTSGGQDDRV
jgi:hypothetical protein